MFKVFPWWSLGTCNRLPTYSQQIEIWSSSSGSSHGKNHSMAQPPGKPAWATRLWHWQWLSPHLFWPETDEAWGLWKKYAVLPAFAINTSKNRYRAQQRYCREHHIPFCYNGYGDFLDQRIFHAAKPCERWWPRPNEKLFVGEHLGSISMNGAGNSYPQIFTGQLM